MWQGLQEWLLERTAPEAPWWGIGRNAVWYNGPLRDAARRVEVKVLEVV